MRRFFTIILICFASNGIAQDFLEEIKEYRQEYEEKIFKEFPNSEVDFFTPDQKFKVNAKYKKMKNGKIISIPTSGIKIKDYLEFALVKFKVDGKKYQMTIYQPMPVNPDYKNHLFLPILDETAPVDTYGGGRYMDLSISDFKKGKVIIDFNKLYNPYCVFSDGWNCPIPPKNNHLSLRIEAGEKLPLTTEYDFN